MRLTFHNNIKGFTLIEVLLTTILISLVTGSFLYIYNSAESSRLVSMAKAEVQAEVRRAMDWIANDVRQTTVAKITDPSNIPPSTSTNIKFRKIIGYSVKDGAPSSDFGNFIEYTYNSDSKTIIRIDFDQPSSTWIFNNIVIQLPDKDTGVPVNYPIFNTRKLNGDIEPLTAGSFIDDMNLVIQLVGKKEVKLPLTTVDLVYILKEEVYIRN